MTSFTTLWRPSIPVSKDGLPLATSVSHMFTEFPYDYLPENKFVSFFLRPEAVFGSVIFYLTSKPIVEAIRDILGVNPKSMTFRTVIAVHNLGLAVFSAVVMWNSWPIVISHLNEYGWKATYCDQENTLWGSGFGGWAVIFYISKYYEFVDTWVLVFKGKQPSLLQVYHHTGVVLNLWAGVISQSAWLLFVVLLNSAIHTIMYTYFLIKTISPKTEIKSARYITTAQICQFFIGMISTAGIQIMGDSCDSASSRFGLAGLELYGVGLILLFMAFAKRKYKKL